MSHNINKKTFVKPAVSGNEALRVAVDFAEIEKWIDEKTMLTGMERSEVIFTKELKEKLKSLSAKATDR